MKKAMLFCVVLAAIACLSQICNGGILWPGHFYGLDAYMTWGTTTTTYATGYWGGWYPYMYGGFLWGPYHGWWYNAPPSFNVRYGLGWGAPYWYYGFTDYVTVTATVPRVVFTWSRYWDPLDTGWGRTLDIWTGGDDALGIALPLPASVAHEATVGTHYFSVNGGEGVGQFSDLVWVSATAPAIRAYLDGLGLDGETINDILDDKLFIDLIANNTGNDVIGLQLATYIPEPATIMLLGAGGILLLRRR